MEVLGAMVVFIIFYLVFLAALCVTAAMVDSVINKFGIVKKYRSLKKRYARLQRVNEHLAKVVDGTLDEEIKRLLRETGGPMPR